MPNHLFDALFADRSDDERPLLRLVDGAVWSFSAVRDLAARMATVFDDAGIGTGDRLVVQVEKSPAAVALTVACVQSGVVFVPLNTAYTAAEVGYFVRDAEPAAVVADGARAASLAAVAGHHGADLLVLNADGSGSLGARAAVAGRADPVDRGADDLAAILYTSGTTGRSKGAMLSHENLRSNALALVDAWRFTEHDVLVHALPIFHTHGLFVAVNTVAAAGASMIFLPRFDVDEIIRQLPRATTMMGVPTFYTRLLAHTEFTRELVAHMRLFVSGSAPLLAGTHREFADRTGLRILERYGMTETGMITSNPYDGERRAGTVGFALPDVDVRVRDPEHGGEVEPGRVGVVEVRGPNVFSGYWRMPERTADEFRPDGYFVTGDLADLDDDGYLRIVGRGKDLIITGGLNVYPKEVEGVVDEIPGVDESAVIGVPHPDLGEGVVAVVARVPGAELDDRAVLAALAPRLARFKQPKKVVFVETLPRNTMGKVQKNLLREEFGAILTP